MSGDWGIVDNVDTPAVFRPSNTTFFFRHSNTQGNADESIFWGQSNMLPVAGTWTVGGGGTPPTGPPAPPPGPFCQTVTGITQGDCEALLTLYGATGGPAWTNKGNWAVSKTPCTDWPGVTCFGDRVYAIDPELGTRHRSGATSRDRCQSNWAT